MSEPGEDPLPAGIPAALLDLGGVVIGWNRSAEELFLLPAAAARGHDLPELLFPPDLLRSAGRGLEPFSHIGSTSRRPEGRWTVPVVRGDGSAAIVDVTLAPASGPESASIVATFHPMAVSSKSTMPGLPVLQRIFESAPEAITVLDRYGRQQFVNANGLDLLGYGSSDGEPVDAHLLVHPDDLPELAGLRSPFDEAGRPTARRFRARTSTGSWHWLETVATDLTADPVVRGYIVFTRDVTADAERALALRTAEARLASVVANLRPGALLEDADGHPVLWNDALARTVTGGDTSVAPAAALGEVAAWATDPGAAAASVARLASEAGTDVVHLGDGRVLELESVHVGEPEGSLGRLWLVRDVSHRVEAERQRDGLLRLEQEARRLAEEQAAHLQDFDQLRSDFVATVSHELRTPLTSVISAVDYLLTCTPEEQAEDLQRFLELIARNAVRLSRLVDDLLVVSRLDTGILVLHEEQVDPVALVASLLDDLAPRAVERNVTLRLRSEPGPLLRADPVRLQQVVENLVTNAIKFTEPGTAVDIRCTHRDGAWTIAVRDRGPGVADDERERIFERFYRARSAQSAGTLGTGLGLTIARGLVALHGGTLGVRSPSGGGAELVCVLPVRPIPSP